MAADVDTGGDHGRVRDSPDKHGHTTGTRLVAGPCNSLGPRHLPMPTRDNCPTTWPGRVPPIVDGAIPTFGGGQAATVRARADTNRGWVGRAGAAGRGS